MLTHRLVSWVDASTLTLGPVQRGRVRVQHLITLLMVIIGLPYAGLYAVVGIGSFSVGLALAAATSVLGLFLLTRRGRVRTGGVVVSVGYFLACTQALVVRGGMHSNSAAWLLLSAVVAFLMVDRRHGTTVSAATAAVFMATWGVEALGLEFPVGLPPDLSELILVVDFPIMAAAVAVLLWIQAGIWNPVVASLDRTNKQLQGEVLVREQAEHVARESAKARETFLATMSHEIRTPLNGVLGLTEVLLDTGLSSPQRRLVSTVHGSGQVLLGVLNDVLDYSKIDAGHLELEQVAFDVYALCDEVARIWRPEAIERGLQLRLERKPDAATWFVGDPSKLRKIVAKLVSNAVKFTETGHVRVAVSTEGPVIIAVEDTGIGLSNEALVQVFEPFQQADGTTTRRFGGAGLGLAICKRLCEAMSGSLEVRSRVQTGTTFTLTLPLDPAPEPALQPHDDQLPDLVGKRVLVAEDNPVNQVVVRSMLARYGLDVALVADGEACIAQCAARPPDLILMDCQMPRCDGYEATRRLREAGVTIPIVALTASTSQADQRRSLEAGMDGHLGKPIRPRELEATLARWLTLHA